MTRTALTMAVVAATGAAASASVFQDWNLIVRNNLTITSEVDGSALIGGDITGTSNYAVQGVTASNGAGLMVGGTVAAGTNLQINNAGDFYFAGTVNGIVNLNGGGTSYYQPTIANTVSNAFAQADAFSTYLAGLSATGTVDGAGNMNASTVAIGSEDVAVYSMTQATIAGLGQLNLNFGSADIVVINFDAAASGGAANFQAPPNFVGALDQANSGRIVWNFINTTSLTVNNNFNGMILATDANLALLGGGINGTVIVDNISTMNAEIRNNTFQGLIPAPGSVALLGLGGLVAVRRRR
jgi:choice-of-anchor A domain-containing protein